MENTEENLGLNLNLNRVKQILEENNLLIECNIIHENVISISCDSRKVEKR